MISTSDKEMQKPPATSREESREAYEFNYRIQTFTLFKKLEYVQSIPKGISHELKQWGTTAT